MISSLASALASGHQKEVQQQGLLDCPRQVEQVEGGKSSSTLA